jgi:hypothetical protein
MKKLSLIVMAMVLLVSVVAATETTLDDDYISMDYQDVRTVVYCISENENPVDIAVVVNPICKELDGVIGCSAGDLMNPAGFTVVPNEPTTGADGCVELTVTTDLDEETAGTFVYTVNGYNGLTYVGAETGTVEVPEFGVLAAIGVLGLAGLFIYNKRD